MFSYFHNNLFIIDVVIKNPELQWIEIEVKKRLWQQMCSDFGILFFIHSRQSRVYTGVYKKLRTLYALRFSLITRFL